MHADVFAEVVPCDGGFRATAHTAQLMYTYVESLYILLLLLVSPFHTRKGTDVLRARTLVTDPALSA